MKTIINPQNNIGKALYLFSLFLDQDDYQPYDQLPEVKEIVNLAIDEYINLHKFNNIYNQLIDKKRDNL